MDIFISYSDKDSVMVEKFAAALSARSDINKVHWWAESNIPGKQLWDSIFGWINNADMVFVVITNNTIERALSVGNEIGYARGRNKRIVSFVAPGIDTSDLGCLASYIHIPLVPGEIEAGVERALAYKPKVAVKHRDQMISMDREDMSLLKPVLAFTATYLIANWLFDES